MKISILSVFLLPLGIVMAQDGNGNACGIAQSFECEWFVRLGGRTCTQSERTGSPLAIASCIKFRALRGVLCSNNGDGLIGDYFGTQGVCQGTGFIQKNAERLDDKWIQVMKNEACSATGN
ncbi:hypothetical protein INT43_004077 [Umbelopsis isabellina]|uniref:Cyanovirin-N domain-containing protein n=1 Tax=Mortierella isabellina TaxID=91625 RepID=A0A8H7PU66_MORIS|nr:hypothetical protein INT43_004077 [Umbelopsis isabellina]